MSHFTNMQTQIKDITALKQAVKELGLGLVENGIARGYKGNSTKGDYVIRLKGPYDVALIRQTDGTYGIVTDWWAGHVAAEIGHNGGKLLQAYGVNVATNAARKQGHSVTRSIQNDGSIKLTVSVR